MKWQPWKFIGASLAVVGLLGSVGCVVEDDDGPGTTVIRDATPDIDVTPATPDAPDVNVDVDPD